MKIVDKTEQVITSKKGFKPGRTYKEVNGSRVVFVVESGFTSKPIVVNLSTNRAYTMDDYNDELKFIEVETELHVVS